MKGALGPLAFLLTGLAWLVLSALLGFALYIGLVRGTSLPASLRLIHVHAALVGGLLQMLIGALLHRLPPTLPSGRQRPAVRPGLYVFLNGGTLGMLIGFGLSHRVTVGIAGLFALIPVLTLLSDALRLRNGHTGDETVRAQYDDRGRMTSEPLLEPAGAIADADHALARLPHTR